MPITLRKSVRRTIEIEAHGSFIAAGSAFDAITSSDLLGTVAELSEGASLNDLRGVCDACAAALAGVITAIEDVTDLDGWPASVEEREEALKRWPSSILIPFAIQWAIGETEKKSDKPSDGPR